MADVRNFYEESIACVRKAGKNVSGFCVNIF